MSARFRAALEGIDYRNWQLFEEVAAKFTSDEFPTLRTLADPAGDAGRDGVLQSSEDYPNVAVQYSVTDSTSKKIRATARVLNEKHPEVSLLVYLTPRQVTTKTRDAETIHLRKHHGLTLDIRDISWFVEREMNSATTQAAAELAGRRIVDPMLSNAGVINTARSELSAEDSRAALFFLSMQREDDDQNRGLTKLCFDALVRAALRGTDNENRMSRSAIHDAVLKLVPTQDSADVPAYADRALGRLERQAVRHWTADDSFCLSFEERKRLVEEMVQLNDLERSFNAQLRHSLEFVASSLGASTHDVEQVHIDRARRVIETYLF